MKNIILVGTLMVGKHTLGKRVAEILNVDFIDIDEFLTKKFQESEDYKAINTQKKFMNIIRNNPKSFFEKKYYPFLKEFKHDKSFIMVGSPELPLSFDNYYFLIGLGTIIYIKRDPDIILKQIQDNYPDEWKEKNAKNKDCALHDIRELLIFAFKDKEGFYQEIADFTIDNNDSIEEGVNKLANLIKKIWDENLKN